MLSKLIAGKLAAALPLLLLVYSLPIFAQDEEGNADAQASPTQQTQPPNLIPLVPRVQEGYFTCWSTCAEMIFEVLGGVPVSQCEQANPNPIRGVFPCCTETYNLRFGWECDYPSLPDFPFWGFPSTITRTGSPLTWNEIKGEIDEGRPFTFSLLSADGLSSHMMVVAGYSEHGGSRALIIHSPGFSVPADAILVPFEWYRSGSTVGTGNLHQYDIFNIR